MNAKDLSSQFAKAKILVLGDAMLDAYYLGKVSRISPEAPVPVVEIEQKTKRLGGAANVALNCVDLGAKVALCSMLGNDTNGKIVAELCAQHGIGEDFLLFNSQRPTTVKTRIISRGQHLLRVDEEDVRYLSVKEEEELLIKLKQAIINFVPDVLIFEDYNKGLLSERIIFEAIKFCKEKGVKTTVDPKYFNFYAYQGVDVFKPNLKELKEGLKLDLDPSDLGSLEAAIKQLMQKLPADSVFVTLSEHGVYFKNGQHEGKQLAAFPRKILDVSGAGDTVIAIASVALAAGCTHELAYALANLGGGMVCEKEGVVPINLQELMQEAHLQKLL